MKKVFSKPMMELTSFEYENIMLDTTSGKIPVYELVIEV